ncbi:MULTISPECIES: hypothetical protein [unclassified Polaromonas]|jgi:hypothetical protein|uniref:hypothetical protein n=1 Tax=unclassified Polaromonas TaxID=2638319 RepID=UPI0025F986CA|nr:MULTISPECIES: hypothetical protein [unclassified Polaromonas]HQR99195.1 hypothetical protein [Polaromonas sp.]HQS40401.1 hypothetical protein [Polaromonas sp.]HQS89050.1 hypothetical protein [Polaromonas sp.]HQT06020.1 hypothetical protein [Polaromonas sp.]
MPKLTPYQVNVAAEAFTCVVMSQAGYDVAMQYGTTQPDWDILATKGSRTLKLQVKGSQTGGWGLFQGNLKDADYHGALDAWLARELEDVVYVFVQFKNVPVGAAPRCYLARPLEIVQHMRTTRGGHARTTLKEKHAYSRGVGAGHEDVIPPSWLFSHSRVDTL